MRHPINDSYSIFLLVERHYTRRIISQELLWNGFLGRWERRKSQLNVLWKRLSYIVQIERKQTRKRNNSGASAGVKLIAYSVHWYSREEDRIIQSLAESTIAADGLTRKNIQVGNRRRFAFASKCEFRLGGRLAVNSVGTRYPRHRKKVEVDIFSPIKPYKSRQLRQRRARASIFPVDY